MMGEVSRETSPKNIMIQDMINSENSTDINHADKSNRRPKTSEFFPYVITNFCFVSVYSNFLLKVSTLTFTVYDYPSRQSISKEN